MKKMTLEESMQSIAISLSNVTEMGQYINISTDTPETDLTAVENNLEQAQIGISNINATLEDLHSNTIETNNNLELIVMQLSRIADALEKK